MKTERREILKMIEALATELNGPVASLRIHTADKLIHVHRYTNQKGVVTIETGAANPGGAAEFVVLSEEDITSFAVTLGRARCTAAGVEPTLSAVLEYISRKS